MSLLPGGSSPRIFDVSSLCRSNDDVCSIKNSGMVYEDAELLYAEVQRDGKRILDEAFSVLIPGSVPFSPETPMAARIEQIVAFNTTFFSRTDVIKIPLGGKTQALKANIIHTSRDGTVGYALFNCQNGGSLGTALSASGHLPLPVSGDFIDYPCVLR
jgi:hypothetical protein